MGCAILKFATAPLSDMNVFLCFRIFDRPGLNFNAINLKILHMVGLIKGYNLYEFRINSLQIEVRMSFLVWQNSSALLLRFAILKFATGSS